MEHVNPIVRPTEVVLLIHFTGLTHWRKVFSGLKILYIKWLRKYCCTLQNVTSFDQNQLHRYNILIIRNNVPPMLMTPHSHCTHIIQSPYSYKNTSKTMETDAKIFQKPRSHLKHTRRQKGEKKQVPRLEP